jgi:ubiquinone/menaquinone biosynthesis C-methylase UbiE
MSDALYWEQLWTRQAEMPVNNFARRAFHRIQARGLQTLLDIGCGTGQDSVYFAKKGMSVTALDLVSSSLERLSQREKRITCLTQDICQLNFPEGSYDVIYAHLSLQYFDDRQSHEIFANIFKILKKGGLFFVKCKSTTDRLYGEGENIGQDTFIRGHIRHFFSRDYMAEVCRPFQVLSLRKTCSRYGKDRSCFIEAVATKQDSPL